jgi:hypothetical protein
MPSGAVGGSVAGGSVGAGVADGADAAGVADGAVDSDAAGDAASEGVGDADGRLTRDDAEGDVPPEHAAAITAIASTEPDRAVVGLRKHGTRCIWSLPV